MKQRIRHLWLILLTGMLVLGLGLRGLPAPCQNGHCGPGGCATSLTPCPPSCTCHWSHGLGNDPCCHAGTGPMAHGASHGDHPEHSQAHPHDDALAMTHEHGDSPSMAHEHCGPHDPVAHGHTAPAAHDHPAQCASTEPAADDGWPNLSLPHIQPPALLAAAVTLSLAIEPDQPPTVLPAVIPHQPSPSLRPPAA